MNLRSSHEGIGSGHESTSAGAGCDPEGLGENGHENDSGESHEAPLLAPPPPPSPPSPLMTQAEMMAEVLAACRETTRALDMMAQAIGGLARGGPDGNGGNGGGACGLERPYSY
jgi:hypothetical protein